MTYKYNVATTVGGTNIQFFYHPLTVPVNCRCITMNTIAISQSERPKTIYLMNDLNGSTPCLYVIFGMHLESLLYLRCQDMTTSFMKQCLCKYVCSSTQHTEEITS